MQFPGSDLPPLLRRFFLTSLGAAGLFAACCLMLILWGFFPENRLLAAAGAVLAVWFAAYGCIVGYRLYRRLFRPLGELQHFAAALSRGEYPAPLKTGNRNGYADLAHSLNVLRDRLQNLNARLQEQRHRDTREQASGDEAGELRSRILTNLAPDLRIPLNAMSGYEYLLTRHPDAPQREHWLNAMSRNVLAAERIIERMVDIGQLSRFADTETDKEVFDTASFMRRVVEYNALHLGENGITLLNRFSAKAPEELLADREMLFQLLNILIRVIAHTAENGDTIEFACFAEGNQVVFDIRDSGGCRGNDSLAALFKTCRGAGGEVLQKKTELTMLGLLFVESQAAGFGARLEVTAAGENGTELQLILPESVIAPPRRAASGPGAIHFAGNAGQDHRDGHAAYGPGPAAGQLRHLLLIDTDRDFAEILETLLPNAELTTYPTLDKLPGNFDIHRFDAAILAIVPRWGRNYSVATLDFLANAEQAGVPVVAMLTDRSERLRRTLGRGGASRIMTKPIAYNDLVNFLTGTDSHAEKL